MKLDTNEVLGLYESVLKDCPQCGKKMLWMDWSDYCEACDLSITRSYDTLRPTIKKEEKE